MQFVVRAHFSEVNLIEAIPERSGHRHSPSCSCSYRGIAVTPVGRSGQQDAGGHPGQRARSRKTA